MMKKEITPPEEWEAHGWAPRDSSGTDIQIQFNIPTDGYDFKIWDPLQTTVSNLANIGLEPLNFNDKIDSIKDNDVVIVVEFFKDTSVFKAGSYSEFINVELSSATDTQFFVVSILPADLGGGKKHKRRSEALVINTVDDNFHVKVIP